MKYVIDTCIINKLLDGEVQEEELPNDGGYVITTVQVDEINNTSDKDRERRARLNIILIKLKVDIVSTESIVFGVTRFNNMKFGDGVTYKSLLSSLDEKNKRKHSNARDAVIAETALKNGHTLLTTDKDLSEVAREHGCKVELYGI